MEPTITDQLERVLERLEEKRVQAARYEGARELSLAITKAQECRMWLEQANALLTGQG